MSSQKGALLLRATATCAASLNAGNAGTNRAPADTSVRIRPPLMVGASYSQPSYPAARAFKMAKKKRAARKAKTARKANRYPRSGTGVIYPVGVQEQLGVSAPTRWRMEKDGRLPPRDFFVGGVAVGWRPPTLEAA